MEEVAHISWDTSMDPLDGICKRLLDYDPGIVEIVQFGSSVYAPERAEDADLLVITEKSKDYSATWMRSIARSSRWM